MNEPVFNRLHPLTILVEMGRVMRHFAIIFIIFVVQYLSNPAKADYSEMLLGAVGGVTVIFAIIRYFSYGYAIHNGNLIVKEGIITKKHRTIPLDRIQNINLKRGILHQVLGLVDLEVETAGGGKAEAHISALSQDDAHSLKIQLTGGNPATSSPFMEKRRDVPLYTASFYELFLAGATQNKAMPILAAVMGLFSNAFSRTEVFKNIIKSLPTGSNSVLIWTFFIFAFIAFGWIASIVMTFVGYFKFELSLGDGCFKRSYGLVNHIENVVPIHRVQNVRLEENWIQRLLKVCRVYVDTAGAYAEGRRENQADIKATPLLTPMLENSRLSGIITLAIPGFDFQKANWSSLSVRSIYRHIYLGFLWAAIIGGAIYALVHYRGDIPLMPFSLKQGEITGASPYFVINRQFAYTVAGILFGLSAIGAIIRFKTAGYWDQGEVIAARQGIWTRTTKIAPINKIQSTTFSQSPSQRRFGLATITLLTAAMSGHSTITIEDIDAKAAIELAESLHERAAEEAWANPDGF